MKIKPRVIAYDARGHGQSDKPDDGYDFANRRLTVPGTKTEAAEREITMVDFLVSELERAGFVNRGGRGSHRNYVHPKVARPITISGALGDDALHHAAHGCSRRLFDDAMRSLGQLGRKMIFRAERARSEP